MAKRLLDRILGLIGFEIEEDDAGWEDEAVAEDGLPAPERGRHRRGRSPATGLAPLAAADPGHPGRVRPAGQPAGPAPVGPGSVGYPGAPAGSGSAVGRVTRPGGAPRSPAEPGPAPRGREPDRAAFPPPAPRRGSVVNLPADRTAGGRLMQVMVITPATFDEVPNIAENLRLFRPVIINLEGVDRELARRVIDFMSGATYALEGNTQRIGNQIFLFTPANVEVALDSRAGWAGQGGDA